MADGELCLRRVSGNKLRDYSDYGIRPDFSHKLCLLVLFRKVVRHAADRANENYSKAI